MVSPIADFYIKDFKDFNLMHVCEYVEGMPILKNNSHKSDLVGSYRSPTVALLHMQTRSEASRLKWRQLHPIPTVRPWSSS